ASRDLYLCQCSIESACPDLGKTKLPRIGHDPPQPGTRTATRIQNRHRASPRGSKVRKLPLDKRPDMAVRIAVEAREAKQPVGVAVCVGEIITAGLVVDRSDIAAANREREAMRVHCG